MMISAIAKRFIGSPMLEAPIVLPISDPNMLAVLRRAGILKNDERTQAFAPSLRTTCYKAASNCREIAIGTLTKPNPIVLRDVRETQRTIENGPMLFGTFEFLGTVTTEIGRVGVARGYWVSYNAKSSKCPTPLQQRTTFLGDYGTELEHPELSDPVDIEPGIEVSTRAETPQPRELLCRSQLQAVP